MTTDAVKKADCLLLLLSNCTCPVCNHTIEVQYRCKMVLYWSPYRQNVSPNYAAYCPLVTACHNAHSVILLTTFTLKNLNFHEGYPRNSPLSAPSGRGRCNTHFIIQYLCISFTYRPLKCKLHLISLYKLTT